MSSLTIDLMGDCPLTEAEIQARTQDEVNAVWPEWKRERAVRWALVGNMTELLALNTFFDGVSVEVDASRGDSTLLSDTLAVEAAESVLAQPLAEDDSDAEIRAAATAAVASARSDAVALAQQRKAAKDVKE
jgi:hypothetical protein